MSEVILNGVDIESQVEFHRQMKKLFEFPDYYGENLDALWDMLTAWIQYPVTIVWTNADRSRWMMGTDFDKIVSVFERAKTDIKGFDITYHNGDSALIQLKEIDLGFYMDTGVPAPFIIANDNNLHLLFYEADTENLNGLSIRNNVYDHKTALVTFNSCAQHIFGYPNDETLSAHPYYKLGLRHYGFYEVINSDRISLYDQTRATHPQYNPDRIKNYKHYIITFHDNTFECLAHSFTVLRSNDSTYHRSLQLINDIFKEQI